MNYEKIYKTLCNSRGFRGIKVEKGFEVHHILPKSMGGSDNYDNLVKLTHREHKLVHKLLPKFTKGIDKFKMIQASVMMQTSSKYPEIPYPLVRECLSLVNNREPLLLPYLDFKSQLLKDDSTVFSRNFPHNVRTKGSKFLTTLDLMYFAVSRGFIGVQGLYRFKESNPKVFKGLVNSKVICDRGLFTEFFNGYVGKSHHCRTKKFYMPAPKVSFISNLLRIMNDSGNGVLVTCKKLRRGRYILIKSLPCTTDFEHMLYKEVSCDELRCYLKLLK